MGTCGVLVLGAIVFGVAWLRQGSDPAVEELRALLVAREAARAQAPQATPQTPEAASAPSDAPMSPHPSWDELVARGNTLDDAAMWETVSIPRHERSDEDWQALAAMLEEWEEWMAAVPDLVAAGAHLQEFGVLSLDDSMIQSEHNQQLMRLTQLRNVEMALHVHQGDHDAALDILLDSWEMWKNAPGDDVRDTMLATVAGQLVELDLGPATLEPEQVRRVVDALGGAGFQQSLENRLVDWAQVGMEVFREVREGFPMAQSFSDRAFDVVYTTFLLRRDESAYAQHMTRLIHSADMPYFAAWDEIEPVVRALDQQTGWLWTPVTSMWVSTAISQRRMAARSEAEVELARLGLLIELHHAEHGAWPEDLALLAPELGGEVPVDPFSGQPYRYQPTAEGFTLYSLGPNMQDNGGHHGHRGESDIVWRRGA